ncbi:MAG: hypothetical protein ACD_15C00172G0001 [uncultured bacterium]|nr:MAG: hypothetical protein ACD_15C00172G0001 [uncultured bacterium]HCU70954.1 hypothetical protein [Candidatus Moranbacteria bacterium]
MSLSEIKNKLYKKNLDPDLASHDESEFDSRNENVDSKGSGGIEEMDTWKEVAPIPEQKKKKAFKIAAIALSSIVGILALLIIIYFVRDSLFNENRVVVSLSGPTEARSGKFLSYEVSYENKNIVSLKNAELRIIHPENFKPEESETYQNESPTVTLVKLGDLAGKSSGKIAFNGRSYAPKGTLAYLKTELTYEPSNFSSSFVSRHQLGVNVISTPMSIEILSPQDLASGDALDYQISYKNVGAEDFENIRIKVDFPDGFIFSKSEPNVSEGNDIWYIGRLSSGESGKIVISGKLQGERGVTKTFKAYVGAINQGQFVSYNEESTNTKIASSPLSIIQLVNDSINYYPNAGDKLRFEIRYKNEGDLGLKNLIITVKMDSPILDYKSIEFDKGGTYDTENNLFVWKSSDHEQLANLGPGESGSVVFSIKVKDLIPINMVQDKNFVVSSIVKIDSPDIPTPINMNKIIAGNRLDMKLNSKILMEIFGFYTEPHIGNSGPIPPVVGKETTYSIRLKAGNVSNDVTNAKIEIVLPTGVTATGKLYPGNSPVSYNERANVVTWDLGTIRSSEGILSPFREVTFQIKVNPSPNQVGKSMDIIKESVFSAKDSFTGQNLVIKSGSKNIILLEDPTIGALGWKVVQ